MPGSTTLVADALERLISLSFAALARVAPERHFVLIATGGHLYGRKAIHRNPRHGRVAVSSLLERCDRAIP